MAGAICGLIVLGYLLGAASAAVSVAARAGAAAAAAASGPSAPVDFCAFVVDNKTCVINSSVIVKDGATIFWKGDVNVTGTANVTARIGNLTIQAGGSVNVEGQSALCATFGSVQLNGSFVTIRDTPTIFANGALELFATSGGIDVFGLNASLQPILTATVVNISASGQNSVRLSAALHQVSRYGSMPSLQARTGGALTMGPSANMWKLSRLKVVADSVALSDADIRTEGRSCTNNASDAKVDVCAQLLAGDWTTGNVSFDFILLATSNLTVRGHTKIYSGSMLLCSQGQAQLQDTAQLEASGRGCRPGGGAGSGQAPTKGIKCGAGGGSHLGAGGPGVQVDSSSQVRPCEKPGPVYDLGMPALLPTRGASGGGCSEKDCELDKASTAADGSGGGLIWVSAQDLAISTDATINADGYDGGVPVIGHASGGGAGGQVLVFAGSMRATPGASSSDSPQFVKISVRGGDTACASDKVAATTVVSGAGGGGIVGFGSHNGSAPWTPNNGSFQVMAEGGRMEKNCQGYVPQSGWHVTNGDDGQAIPLAPCDGGHAGMFCTPCRVGTWSAGGNATECNACANKPSRAEYTASSWPNSSCYYICSAGVPFVAVNKKCLGVAGFFFDFFGGTLGVLLIFFGVLLLSALLLWRSRRARRRTSGERELAQTRAASFTQRALTWSPTALVRHLRARLEPCERRLRLCVGAPMQEEGEWVFTKERLPFHTCRVYLAGSNRPGSPWALPGQLPDELAEEVSAEGWKRLAREAAVFAAAPRQERLVQSCLGLLYPPLAPLHGRWRRWLRVVRLKRTALEFSEGANFWRPVHATFDAHGELLMCFGCDSGATLGYLDFFNFSRSRLDWAPVDLRRQARLLVARGHGTHAEPFAVDATDPLIEDLMQTDLNRGPVADVIVAFNNASRLISQGELVQGSLPDTTKQLLRAVHSCAADRGLAGHVHVLRVVPGSAAAACGLLTSSLGSGAIPSRQVTPSVGTLEDTFTDLVHSVEPSVGAASTRTSAADARRQVKLCLAFADASTAPPGAPLHFVSTLRLPSSAPLASPMACAELWELLSAQPDAAEGSPPPEDSPLWSQLLATVLSWRDGYKADVVLLALVVFLLADLLAFVLLAASLFEISRGVLAAWLLVPPLAQLLALACGVVLLASNQPWTGRLYSAFNLCSAVNAAVATLGLFAVMQLQSWEFSLAQLVVSIGVKLALFVLAGMHTANVEAARDSMALSRSAGGSQGGSLRPHGRISTDGSGQGSIAQPPQLRHVDSDESLDERGGGSHQDAADGGCAHALPPALSPGRQGHQAAFFYGGVSSSSDHLRAWTPPLRDSRSSSQVHSLPSPF